MFLEKKAEVFLEKNRLAIVQCLHPLYWIQRETKVFFLSEQNNENTYNNGFWRADKTQKKYIPERHMRRRNQWNNALLGVWGKLHKNGRLGFLIFFSREFQTLLWSATQNFKSKFRTRRLPVKVFVQPKCDVPFRHTHKCHLIQISWDFL